VKKSESELKALKRVYEQQRAAVLELEKANSELREVLAKLQRARSPDTTTTCSAGSVSAVDDFGAADLIIVRPNGRFCRASALFRETLGYSEVEHPELDLFSMLFPEDKTTGVLEQILSGMILAVLLRVRLRSRSGVEVWAQMKAYSLCTSQGDVLLVAYVRPYPTTGLILPFPMSLS